MPSHQTNTETYYATEVGVMPCVRIMSRSGDVLRSIGHDWRGVNKLKSPIGVCVSGQYVYVSDCGNPNIAVFTTDGEYVTSFGQEGVKEGEFNQPFCLCVDKDGFLYVLTRLTIESKYFSCLYSI